MTVDTNNAEAIPAGMKVRFEVVNIIYKNPCRSVKIPSSLELSKKFGISQRTVARELKRLTDEGYIIGKQGVGTFTNPELLPKLRMLPTARIIGVINCDARLLYFSYNDWAFLSHIGMALPPDIAYPRPVTLSVGEPEAVYRELLSINLDGFVWIMPPPKLHGVVRRLREEAGMPVITLLQHIPPVPFIGVNIRQLGQETVALFLRDEHNRIFWCMYGDSIREAHDGAVELLKKNHLTTTKEQIVRDRQECVQKLPKLLRRHEVDAIFVYEDNTHQILEILRECGLSLSEVTLAVEAPTVRRIPGFRGITREYPFAKIGEQAAEWMKILLEQPTALEGAESIFELEIKSVK